MLGRVEPMAVRGMRESPLATLRVVDVGDDHSHAPGTLLRPLEYEALIDALIDLEHSCVGSAAAVPMPRNRHAAPAPAQPGRVSAAAAALPSGASFRLLRWPPVEVLQGNRDYQRLACFLSTQHLELGDLARLSNVKLARCEELLTALAAAGILNMKSAAVARPESRPAAARTALPVPRPTPPLPSGSLFGKIRRGLGLTWMR